MSGTFLRLSLVVGAVMVRVADCRTNYTASDLLDYHPLSHIYQARPNILVQKVQILGPWSHLAHGKQCVPPVPEG